MQTYIVIPKLKLVTGEYGAPSMLVNASSPEEALKQSGLSRFPEWSFHVAAFVCKHKKGFSRPIKSNYSKSSKSQLGKQITGHSDSRPVRRMKRRLMNGTYSNGLRPKTNAKHW